MNYREKSKRASQTARTYGSDDPRNEQVARRKVLEERDASRGSSVPVPAPARSGDSGIRFSLDGWGLGSLDHADFAGRDGVDVIAIQRDGQTFFRFSLSQDVLDDIASGGGGGGAPTTAEYLVGTSDGTLSAERVVTDTATAVWDLSTPGQAAVNVPDGSIGTAKLGGDITAAGIALLDDANAAAQRTTLGLATIASSASAADLTSGTVPTARLGTGSATSSTYLRGDSTWQLLPSMTVADGDKGDITVSSTGTVWTIDAGVVTYAKIQDTSAASVILGRGAGSGAGDVQEITLGTNLSMSGTTLNATGGGGSGTWTEANLNFGSTPTYGGQFTISDGTITGTEKIVVTASGTAPVDLTSDEFEMDGLLLAAVAGVGEITVYAVVYPGPITGIRKILYQAAA